MTPATARGILDTWRDLPNNRPARAYVDLCDAIDQVDPLGLVDAVAHIASDLPRLLSEAFELVEATGRVLALTDTDTPDLGPEVRTRWAGPSGDVLDELLGWEGPELDEFRRHRLNEWIPPEDDADAR